MGAPPGKLAAAVRYIRRMRLGSLLDRIPGWGWLVIVGVALVVSFRLGLGDRLPQDAIPRIAAADAEGSLAGYRVRLETDSLVSIVPTERPAVVMVSSVTCGVCAETMREMASDGRALPGLRIVTLEGAAFGREMARRNGLRDVWHAGPADGSGATLLTFQYPGTPTFLLVEPDGRVRRALVGYPGRDAFTPWLRVMAGETTTL